MEHYEIGAQMGVTTSNPGFTEHNERDMKCCYFNGDVQKGQRCRVCAGLDNAVWLTQRERYMASLGMQV